MTVGSKKEPSLEIESHDVHGFLARKRRTGNRREDSGEIVSSVNSDTLRVSGIGREYERLLELRACRNGTEEQANQQGNCAEHVPASCAAFVGHCAHEGTEYYLSGH